MKSFGGYNVRKLERPGIDQYRQFSVDKPGDVALEEAMELLCWINTTLQRG